MMPSEVTELLRPLRAAYYTDVRELIEAWREHGVPEKEQEKEASKP